MQSLSSYPPRPPVRGVGAWFETVRDRFADPRVRVGAVLVVAGIAGYFWYQVGQGQAAAALPGAPSATTAKTAKPRPAVARPTTTTVPPVLVHVAGAVAHPGLVRVATGARVADAIAAAGGGLPNADLDRLNLAAKVVDGQRIPVARVGDPAPSGVGDPTGGNGSSSDAGGSSGGGPINLNAATAAELETLPGIGPSFAAAIIRERERRGGFTSVDQLRDVRGIGEKRFAELKPLVTV